MAAHDPKTAKRVGVSAEVGREFVEADRASGKKFKESGPQHVRSGSKAKGTGPKAGYGR